MPEMILILIRSLLSFFVLLVLTRLMGKQQLSQLTFFDYIVGITIGSLASALSVDQNIKITNGLTGLIIWALLPMLLAVLSVKSYRFRKLADGEPTVLIDKGNIQEKNLRKTKISANALMPLLRHKGAFKVSDVELAILEVDGKISVMKKSDAQPVTPKVLGLAVEEDHAPQIVLVDGKILQDSLNKTGYTREWLFGEIQKQGASEFKDVFLAQIDSKGSVYVDLYSDKQKIPQVKQKPLLEASIKKIQADLEAFSLQTENTEAKQIYQDQARQVQKLIDGLQPYLKE